MHAWNWSKKINQEKSPVYSDYPKYFGYHSAAKNEPLPEALLHIRAPTSK